MKTKFAVTGMTCAACSSHVQKAVEKLPGIEDATVSLMTNSMQVTYDENQANEQNIIDAVINAGYGASMVGNAKKETRNAVDVAEEERKKMRRRLWSSVAFLIPLMYVSMHHMFYMWFGLPIPAFMTAFFHGPENAINFAFTQFLLTLPIAYINRHYFENGFKLLFKGSPNMDSLIATGAAASLLYGVFAIFRMGHGLGHGDLAIVTHYMEELYFESAGMILTLITVGKYLEAKSKGKTSEAITKLMDLAPKTAVVLRDDEEFEVPVEEVLVGDVLVIRPGASVPVDGVIVQGNSAVDQSAITGESIPVEKQMGDAVIAASVNKSGYLQVRATKVGEDTTLAGIIRLVEEAASSKAPIAKLADKISGIFVPIVMGIAVVTGMVWLLAGATFEFALSCAIAVLVISCPCALGLATPVAIMAGTGKGAEMGILIKSAEALETAHSIDTVVLDKTGTLTVGKPEVTDILPAQGVSIEALLQRAASVEVLSEHPLADAVIRKAGEMNLPMLPATDFVATAGRGIGAQIEGQILLAGNQAFMEDNQIAIDSLQPQAESLANEGKTPLYFAYGGKLYGVIAVADVLKPTSKAAVEAFHKMGIAVVMLTGDNARTAAAIQRELGIETVIADVLPADKENEIRRLQEQGKKVAMVGDGINDAPALARANVGIAIGAGTDIAIESADIVLMKNDLLDAVNAVHLSRRVMRNIKQNLFWAFFYNTIGIPIAAGVLYPTFGITLSPMLGAAAMSLSSVCVVLNALRLRLFHPKRVEVPQVVKMDNQINTINKVKSEEKKMKKVISVEGMSCMHCAGAVEKALGGVYGVINAKVDLDAKTATVELEKEVADDMLTAAVAQAGYEPLGITQV